MTDFTYVILTHIDFMMQLVDLWLLAVIAGFNYATGFDDIAVFNYSLSPFRNQNNWRHPIHPQAVATPLFLIRYRFFIFLSFSNFVEAIFLMLTFYFHLSIIVWQSATSFWFLNHFVAIFLLPHIAPSSIFSLDFFSPIILTFDTVS